MTEPLATRQKLDVLYQNMLPELKLIFGRKEVITLDELKNKAISAENRTRVQANHRPSPSPENSLLPESATTPLEKPKGKNQPTVAAINWPNSGDPPDWFETWLAWQKDINSDAKANKGNNKNFQKNFPGGQSDMVPGNMDNPRQGKNSNTTSDIDQSKSEVGKKGLAC